MATPATLEQWKELYDLAIEITKLKPWNSYWDMDLIAVETKKNEEPNFVSIMGKSGTCTGISVYRGMEGYSDFCQISNDDYNVPATFVMSDQNCITCYWGNRDEIDDEMYSIIKQLGLRFRGNGNWIYFKTFEKKSFSAFFFSEKFFQFDGFTKQLIVALIHSGGPLFATVVNRGPLFNSDF